jgi:hypothetical protein
MKINNKIMFLMTLIILINMGFISACITDQYITSESYSYSSSAEYYGGHVYNGGATMDFVYDTAAGGWVGTGRIDESGGAWTNTESLGSFVSTSTITCTAGNCTQNYSYSSTGPYGGSSDSGSRKIESPKSYGVAYQHDYACSCPNQTFSVTKSTSNCVLAPIYYANKHWTEKGAATCDYTDWNGKEHCSYSVDVSHKDGFCEDANGDCNMDSDDFTCDFIPGIYNGDYCNVHGCIGDTYLEKNEDSIKNMDSDGNGYNDACCPATLGAKEKYVWNIMKKNLITGKCEDSGKDKCVECTEETETEDCEKNEKCCDGDCIPKNWCCCKPCNCKLGPCGGILGLGVTNQCCNVQEVKNTACNPITGLPEPVADYCAETVPTTCATFGLLDDWNCGSCGNCCKAQSKGNTFFYNGSSITCKGHCENRVAAAGIFDGFGYDCYQCSKSHNQKIYFNACKKNNAGFTSSGPYNVNNDCVCGPVSWGLGFICYGGKCSGSMQSSAFNDWVRSIRAAWGDEFKFAFWAYLALGPGSGSGSGSSVCSQARPPVITTCFPAGTKILMSDGSEENIEDVEIGDSVVSFDEKTGEKVPGEVLELERPIRDHMCELIFKDNSSIKLTNDHPVYTKQGWKAIEPNLYENLKVSKLQVNDEVKSIDEFKELIKINCWAETIQTYNLKTIKNHSNFFAENILVHNNCGQPPPSGPPIFGPPG